MDYRLGIPMDDDKIRQWKEYETILIGKISTLGSMITQRFWRGDDSYTEDSPRSQLDYDENRLSNLRRELDRVRRELKEKTIYPTLEELLDDDVRGYL